MKSLWLKTLLLTGAIALPSHAVLGLGVHLAPAFGPKVKSSSGSIMPDGTDTSYAHIITGGSSGLSGLGVKFWIDFIPVVDVEGTLNVQFGYYDLSTVVNGNTEEVEVDLDVPFVEAKPVYARTTGDVAILYPFFKIPMVKFSAGGGLNYIIATPVVNAAFAKKALTDAGIDENDSQQDVVDAIVDAVTSSDNIEKGIGFFVQAGAKVKPPIIPLAVYGDVKYGFGGPSVSGTSGGQGLTLEAGAAIAF
jgi:hypothetical protein